MSLVESSIRYLRIARQFARIGAIRKSQFRVEFVSQILMDTVWYASHVAVFEILMLHTTSLAGWSRTDLRVFLGFLFVSDAFLMMWLGKWWHFGRDLKDGNLDPVRVRPGSAIFLYFFQSFSLEACFNLAIALGYLCWGLSVAPQGGELVTWLVLPWAVALSFWGRVVLTVLFSIAEFHLLNSDLSHFGMECAMTPAERPLDIFAARVRQFLLFLVPVGALSHMPAAMVLGRYTPLEGLWCTLWMAALGLLVFRWWRRSFRRYESALS